MPKTWVNIQGPGKFCINDSKNGQGLTQGDCGNADSALWRLKSIGGKFIIIAKSKRVINSKKGIKKDGNPIISMVRHNGYNQKWYIDFIKDKKGACLIRNFYSDKCMDNSNSIKKGTIYVQWQCSQVNVNQIFYLTPPGDNAGGLTKLTIAQKIAMTKFKMPTSWINFVGDSGLCLTANGNDKEVAQKECSKQGVNDNWKFVKIANELFEIVSKTGLVLTNRASLKTNGNPVIAAAKAKGLNQRWNVIPLPNGKVLIRNPESAKCIDVDGNLKVGSSHLIYECAADKKTQMITIRSYTGLALDIINKKSIMEPNPNNVTRIFRKGDKTCTCKAKKTKRFRFPKDWVNIEGPGGLCIISAANGGKLTQGGCGEYSDALWKIQRLEKGNYVIVSKHNTAIENENGKMTQNNPAIAGTVTKVLSQRWSLHNIQKGQKFMIEQFGSKLCLDIAIKAKKGNGYVQNDCLKTNADQHFKFRTAKGLPVPTIKPSKKAKKEEAEKKKKNEKQEKEDIKRRKENELKIKRLNKTLHPIEKKVEESIKYVTKKIKKEKDPQKKRELEKILEDLKDSRYEKIDDMCRILALYKDVVVEMGLNEYIETLADLRKEIVLVRKNKNEKRLEEALEEEVGLIDTIKDERKKEIKKFNKLIAECRKKNEKNKKQQINDLKKKIKEQKKKIKEERKEKIEKAKEAVKELKKSGNKKQAKKIEKKIKEAKKEAIIERKIKAEKLEKKVAVLKKLGKKEEAKKIQAKLNNVAKKIKKADQEEEEDNRIKKIKKEIKKEIKALNKIGKPEKAKLLEKLLREIKKKTKDPKEIEKIQIRFDNIRNSHVEKKINKKIPKDYVNIILANGMCLFNGKKADQSYCGNDQGLAWRLISIGGKEYQIESDDGKYLMNKNGLNKVGNEIIITTKEKKGRDEAYIWEITIIKSGQYTIRNPATKKCLETNKSSSKGYKFRLEECKSATTNAYQLYSFDKVLPEKLAKVKSDPKILRLSGKWIHIIGPENLCLKSTSQGSPLAQTKCLNNELELWRIIPMGDNQYSFQNKAGFKISVRNDSRNPKSIMSKYQTLKAEKWSIILKNGKYLIKSSALGKCFETDGKPKHSQIYQMFKCKDDEENQHFRFVIPTTVSLIKGWTQIIGNNFLCLKNTGKGKLLTQETCTDDKEFLWKFEVIEGNTFVIKSKLDESVIDLLDGKTFNGNNLIAFKRKDYKTQKWIVKKRRNAKIRIINKASGTCLDAGKKLNGSPFRIWNCSRKHNGQKFRQEYPRPGNYFL